MKHHKIHKSPTNTLAWAGSERKNTKSKSTEESLQKTTKEKLVDAVIDGFKEMNVQNWWRLVAGREIWRKIVAEAMVHSGLSGLKKKKNGKRQNEIAAFRSKSCHDLCAHFLFMHSARFTHENRPFDLGV